jgi:putative sterol carrier protein
MVRPDHRWYLILAMFLAAFCVGDASAASNEPPNATPQDVFDGMRQSFRPEKAKGAHIKYQWQLSGPSGGDWFIQVDDGKCKIEKGKIDSPDVTFITSDKDWVAMSNGKLSGKWAYFTGRFKIRGPQSLARKLDEMFP